MDGNEWPHIPLHKDATPLEDNFNKLLTNIVFKMSNETLRNVSLLDLPAFGSTIGTLKKGLKKQFIWPIKMNFAILKTNPAINKTAISASYKTLTEDWGDYMYQLENKDYANYFTKEMEKNEFFNFTSFIHADMKTFLTVTAGIQFPKMNMGRLINSPYVNGVILRGQKLSLKCCQSLEQKLDQDLFKVAL